MKLLTATPVTVGSGIYNVSVAIGTGTAKLQYSVEGESFIDITDSSTNTTPYNVELPNCQIQSIITGDSEVWLNTVNDQSDKATAVS